MSDPELAVDRTRRVDQICRRFESQWQSGPPPRIEQYLHAVPEADRAVLLRELIAAEVAIRAGRGQAPSERDYRERFPRQDDLIEAAFCDVAEAALESGAPGGAGGLRYEMADEIARGGMGVVLRARDRHLRRDLAVKVLRPEHRSSPRAIARFLDEARLCGRLEHPGLTPVHELGWLDDGRPFFAMKLIQGRTLAALLEDHLGSVPRPDLERLLTVFQQACQTVAYAHSRGVVHRDLKPANIMVGEFGEVQVMDWGLAKRLREDDPDEASPVSPATDHAAATQAGAPLGTPAYMPPEQASARLEPVDRRADVFGLGAILCEILTGRPPYEGLGGAEVLERARAADLASAWGRLDRCAADPELADLARRCLQPQPDRRPPDAGAVAAEITRYRESVQRRLRAAELAQAEALARAAEERTRRRLAVALAAAVLGLIALGGGGLALLAQQRQAQRARAALALREVELLRDAAAADPAGDPMRWEAARDALRRGDVLLAEASDAPLRTRRLTLARQVERGLAAAEADRRLLDRLEEPRARSVERDLAAADASYAAAFGEAGLDVDRLDPAAAGRALARRPAAVVAAMVAALDDWAIVRRHLPADAGGWRRPLDAARAADPDPWRNALRDALGRGDRDAYARLAEADGLEHRPAPSLWLLGRVLIGAGEAGRAAEVLQRAWRAHPGDFWINLDLSHALTWVQPPRFEEGERYAMAAVALRPGSSGARMGLGIFRHRRGDRAGAEADFRAALRVRPDDALARYNLGNLLADLGRLEEAAVEYRAALRLPWGLASQIHNNLGSILARLGRLEEAAAEYRATLQRPSADIPEVRVNLGSILARLGRPEEAAAEFRAALERNPGLFQAWYSLGFVLVQGGDGAGAAESLRRASALAPAGTAEATAVAALQRQAILLERPPAAPRGAGRPADHGEPLAIIRRDAGAPVADPVSPTPRRPAPLLDLRQ